MVIDEKEVFFAALALPDAEEREAYLQAACAGQPELLGRLRELLAAHENFQGPLDRQPSALDITVDTAQTEGPGAVIGPYKLLEQIGEGGMGTVWMAEQKEPIQRRVAVKVIKAGMDSKQVLARFEAERQALALMDHPNIARVLDAGTTRGEPGGVSPGRPYFVMELVKGTPITKYCDDKHLSVCERLELFGDVCRAVQHAHQKGIIHRDLKPSNILIAPFDRKPVVKVIDFGVAKATGQRLTDATLFTGFGAVVGTPEYMSPEQAETNNQDIDTRSDIYSLGVLLYELLTGSTPLTKKRVKEAALLEVLRVIREEEPPKPSTRLSSAKELPSISAQRQTEPAKLTKLVRGELDWIVMKALEKDRNRRYDTPNNLAKDIERYLNDEPVLACPPSVGYRLRKWLRKHRAAAAAVLGLALMLVILSVGLAANNVMIRNEQNRTQVANARLKGNLELSLKTLDEIYLKLLEDRMSRDPNAATENEELLTKALGFYENFAERNEADPNVRREVANAYRRAAVIHLRTGQYDKAKASLNRAAVVSARLIEDFPADQESKRLLAEVYLNRGEAYLRKGEFETEDFQKGIELLEPLLATNDLDPECLETLSGLHSDLGLSLHRSGDLEQGENHYREAIKLQDRVVAQRDDLPTKLVSIQQLAAMRNNLGFLLANSDRTKEAAKEHRETIELLAEVNAQATTLPGYRRGRLPGYRGGLSVHETLAEAYLHLGRELRALGKSRDAETNMKRSLEFWTQVVQDWPGEPFQRWKLAIVEQSLGALLFDGGRRPEALQHCNRSVDLLRKLEADSPGEHDNQYVLHDSLILMGDLLLAHGEREKAAEQYRQAQTLLEGLVARNPNNVQDANELAWFLAVCADQGFRNPARAVSIAQKTTKQIPQNSSFWTTLGVAQYRDGQWQEAVNTLEKSIALGRGGNSSDWLFRAMAHWQLGEKEAARSWFDKADKELKKFEYPPQEESRWLAEAADVLKIRGDGP
jgi:serine/threonine protein kinase